MKIKSSNCGAPRQIIQKWLLSKANLKILTKSVNFSQALNNVNAVVNIWTKLIIETANICIFEISENTFSCWNEVIECVIHEEKHRIDRFIRNQLTKNKLTSEKVRTKARKPMNEAYNKSWWFLNDA